MTMEHTGFLSGIIEGFYGRPWTPKQRHDLIGKLASESLNTYVYAPKFDSYHRLNWRIPYPPATLKHFQSLIKRRQQKKVGIILSISPGLSIKKNDKAILRQRFQDLKDIGATGMALLMDDIPWEEADPDFHSELVQMLMNDIGGNISWFFCPTIYSGYHLSIEKNAREYLTTIGKLIPTECRIFWTGNTVISRTIDASDLRPVQQMLNRKPLIWDNFPANDYVPANSFFPGPITGRSANLLTSCSGLLINPSENYSASLANMYTLAEWIKNPQTYDPTQAFASALSKLTEDTTSYQVLEDLLGYFYTPFTISNSWNDLLNSVKSYFQNPAEPSPVSTLINLRTRLRDENNLIQMKNIWVDFFPHVRTLLGDLDYLIALCKRIETNGYNQNNLVPRDSRWSTPVADLIQELKSFP